MEKCRKNAIELDSIEQFLVLIYDNNFIFYMNEKFENDREFMKKI